MAEATIDGNSSEAVAPGLTEAQLAKKAAKEAKREAEKLRKAIYREAFAVPKPEKVKVKKGLGGTEKEEKKGKGEGEGEGATTSSSSGSGSSLGSISIPKPQPQPQLKPISISGSTSDDVLLLKTPSKRKRPTAELNSRATATAKAGPSTAFTPSRNGNRKMKKDTDLDLDFKTNANANASASANTETKIKKVDKGKNKPVFTSLIPDHMSAISPSQSPSPSPSQSRLPLYAKGYPKVNDKTRIKGKGKQKQKVCMNDSNTGSDNDIDIDVDSRSSSLPLSPLPPSSPSKKTPARPSSFGRTRTPKSLKRNRSSSSLTEVSSSSSVAETEDEDDGSDYGHQSKLTPKGKGKGKEQRESLALGANDDIKNTPRKLGRPKKARPGLQTSQGEAGPSTPTSEKRTSPTKSKGKNKEKTSIVIAPPPGLELTPEPDSPKPNPEKTQLDRDRAAHVEMMLKKRPVDYNPNVFHVLPSPPAGTSSPSPPPMDPNTASDHEACDDEEELRLVALNRDVDERCPICDDPLPMRPTPEFNALHDKYRAKPISDRLEAATRFCNMHKDLIRTRPLAIHRGYPNSIDMTTIWESIVGTPWIQQRIRRLFKQPFESTVFRGHCSSIMNVGKDRWSRQKWTSYMVAQASPGYYGTLGGQLIRQYMEELRIWGLISIDDDKFSPLSCTEFLTQVMVPEISIMLIMNDRFGYQAALSQEPFEAVWAKANEVRRRSIDYGQYLATQQVDQETLDRYKFKPTRQAREQKSRQLWNVRSKTVKTKSDNSGKVKRPTVGEVVNISISPEPDPEPKPESKSESQPIASGSSPVPNDIPIPNPDPDPESKLPSLVIPDWNRRLSTPLSSPGSGSPKNVKRRSREVKSSGPERQSVDNDIGIDNTEEGAECDAGIFTAIDAMPEVDFDVDMSSESQTRVNGVDANAHGNANTSTNAYDSSSSIDPHPDRIAKPRSNNSKTITQEATQSQDSFGNMDIRSQELKVFDQVVHAHGLEV